MKHPNIQNIIILVIFTLNSNYVIIVWNINFDVETLIYVARASHFPGITIYTKQM